MARTRIIKLVPDFSLADVYKPNDSEKQLFDYIKQDNFHEAIQLLKTASQSFTSNSQGMNPGQSTPLIFSLAKLPKTSRNNVGLEEKACAFLEEAKTTVQLTDSDDAGNFLHHAIWRCQFSIAEKILDIATENHQLFVILTAKNKHKSTPIEDLMAQSANSVASFIKKMAEAEQLIAEYLKKNQREAKEEKSEQTNAHSILEILRAIITSKKQENAAERDLNILYSALSACQELVGWDKLARRMESLLKEENDTNFPYKNEFSRHCVMYSKQLEGYHPHRLLQIYPCNDFGRLKRMYLVFREDHPETKQIINGILERLNEVEAKTYADRNFSDRYHDPVITKHHNDLKKLLNNKKLNSTTWLLNWTSERVIRRHAIEGWPKKRTMIEGAPSQELESFKETIECLKCPQESKNVAVAFSEFMNALEQDSKTSTKTKNIMCSHLDGIAKKFMIEKLTKLSEISSLENELQVKLMGLPPMSPLLKTALGALFGLLAGAAIALTGGLATAPVLAISGGSGLAAGFFHGRKKAIEYQEGFKNEVQHLRPAMNKLSGM